MYMIVFSAQGHRLEHILVYLRKKLFCNVKKNTTVFYNTCMTLLRHCVLRKKV